MVEPFAKSHLVARNDDGFRYRYQPILHCFIGSRSILAFSRVNGNPALSTPIMILFFSGSRFPQGRREFVDQAGTCTTHRSRAQMLDQLARIGRQLAEPPDADGEIAYGPRVGQFRRSRSPCALDPPRGAFRRCDTDIALDQPHTASKLRSCTRSRSDRPDRRRLLGEKALQCARPIEPDKIVVEHLCNGISARPRAACSRATTSTKRSRRNGWSRARSCRPCRHDAISPCPGVSPTIRRSGAPAVR